MTLKSNTVYTDNNNVSYRVKNKTLYCNGEAVEVAKNNQILLNKLAEKLNNNK